MMLLSNRSKARMAIAALDLTDRDVEGLDVLVRETVIHPFVGPLIGLKSENLLDLIEEILDFMSDDDRASLLSDVVPLLANPRMCHAIAGGILSVVKQLKPEHQTSFVSILSKVSDMDIPQFKSQSWRDEHHFLSEGLLPFIHATSDVEVAQPSCPHCGLFLN